MIERCGDRQRKFDGLEKWPFRFFIESLPIMLQIALFLLTCGLSRYMWSVNTSVARVVISFTVLGILFYIGIVAAGTSSYECPFQTPVSIGLRHLRDSGTTRKLLANLSPPKIISLIHATRRNTRRLVARLSLPNAVSLILCHLDGCPAGTRFGIPPRLRHHAIPIVLGDFAVPHHVWHSQCAYGVGHKPSFYFSDRSSFREREAETGPRDSKVQACSTAPAHPSRMRPSATLHLETVQGCECVYGTWKPSEQNGDNARCVCWVSGTSLTPKPSTLPYVLRGPSDGSMATPTTTHRTI
jgi:hypothetical protein